MTCLLLLQFECMTEKDSLQAAERAGVNVEGLQASPC
jgi:hypothetical protein